MPLIRVLTWPLRTLARLALAVRFWAALGYSWHVSWIKAER